MTSRNDGGKDRRKIRYAAPPTRALACLCSLGMLGVSLLGMTGCGSSHNGSRRQAGWNQHAKHLRVDANASTYAGPAPLKVSFSQSVTASAGNVRFRWSFGDGETSTDQNPTHTYTKPRFYNVFADAIDERGHKQRTGMILRAYRPEVWAKTQSRGASATTARQSAIEYYREYPQALPTDPKSRFYKIFPYLRPLLKEVKK